MKKTLSVVCAALMALMSCQKEAPSFEPEPPAGPVEVVFNLSAAHPDGPDTKAVKTGWETGDVVFVFFSGQTAPAYLELKWDGSRWVDTPSGLAFTESETGTMTAVFLPFGSDATVLAGDAGGYVFDKITYSYYLTARLPYTVSGGEVSGRFDMRVPEGYIQFFQAEYGAGHMTQIELRERHLTPRGIATIAADGTIRHTDMAHGAPLPGYFYDKENKLDTETKGYLFSGILAEEARNVATDYHFTMVTGGWQGRYRRTSAIDKTLYRGEQEGRALKFSSWTLVSDYKPIDLGCDVPTGVGDEKRRIYWCIRNLGATSDYPADASDAAHQATWGDYYAWGETEPYYEAGTAHNNPPTWKAGKEAGYAWASYSFDISDGHDGSSFSRYTGSDYDILLPEDDAARVKLGGNWRIPTIEEWKALMQSPRSFNPDFTMEGKYTFRVASSEGNYIILPHASMMIGQNLFIFPSRNSGLYWSSNLSSSAADVVLMMLTPGFNGPAYSSVNRSMGNSIRPVTE